MERTTTKSLSDLLLLGDPRLYEVCEPVLESEMHLIPGWVADLHAVMEEIRAKYRFGRAIAAPQIGVMKRLIYLNIDGPMVLVNPELRDLSHGMFEVWDDCMSFPNLLVRLERHQSLRMSYLDEHWKRREMVAQGAISELLQHECDHLDGILCTMRAKDEKSFKWRP